MTDAPTTCPHCKSTDIGVARWQGKPSLPVFKCLKCGKELNDNCRTVKELLRGFGMV